MRDKQIKKGTYTSGLPEGYETWALQNLKELENTHNIKNELKNI
tara:strand:- start:1337 stop:1468 length:132 start_codon:yes stop_codon:yes gene_type:complete